jgi:transcriptional regulator with XRE-family HTH domain
MTAAAQFGAMVRANRKARGLKVWQVAEKANIDAKHLGRIERGEKHPSFELIIALAQALSVSPARFFEFETTALDHKTLRKQIDALLKDRKQEELQRAREVLNALFEF